jgi:iron complex outermembrane receptor protein
MQSLHAQDTIALNEVNVIAQRTVLSSIGKKTESIDSTTKEQFIFNNLGDILSLNTPIFIKSYGPGALSTSAFRGGSASQTAMLWNGFNIQSGMLGQNDLALLPVILFDDITIEYGGSSSLWGSGAVGGSIHLNNKPFFDKGFTTAVNVSSGSFGLFNASTKIEYSKKKLVSSTKAYLQNSTNNFKYTDTLDKTDPLKKQKHAAYSFKGVMQDFRFLVNQKQTLHFNIWYNTGIRQIPVFNQLSFSRPEQTDGNLKTTLSWDYKSNRFKSILRGAYFNDKLIYTDSAFAINSGSQLQTVITENENTLQVSNNDQINFGVNYTSFIGETDNYNGIKTLQKAALFLGNKLALLNERLLFYTSLRAEYISTGKLPVTGSAAVEYKFLKHINAKLNAAKVYRQPTLNELYWQPGGNPNLLPEQGYTYEGDLSYKKNTDRFVIQISGSAFYRIIQNWILWVPGPNATTPLNIQEVFSRGTETSWRLGYKKNKLRAQLNIITGYVLSTVQSSSQENGNTTGKQLIYTPRYTVNGNAMLSYDAVTLTYYHQYIGYRFTASDNFQWLNPYHQSGVRMNIVTKINESTPLILFAACNNIFNANYSIIAGRYMPMRNFEFGITISTTNPNKQKTTTQTQ